MSQVSCDSWLAAMKLQEYADRVKEAGYDQLDFLKSAEQAEVEEMMAAVKTKTPHKRMFKAAWQDLLQQPAGLAGAHSPLAGGAGSPPAASGGSSASSSAE